MFTVVRIVSNDVVYVIILVIIMEFLLAIEYSVIVRELGRGYYQHLLRA